VPGFESLSCVVAPCRDGFRVLTLERVPPISGESDFPFSDRASGPFHTTNCRRTKSAGDPDGRSGPVSTGAWFSLCQRSSDYGSPSSYYDSAVVTDQGGRTLGSISGQEGSTSGWHQAAAQLEDRGRSPLTVALVPRTPHQALPPTAEVEAPTIICVQLRAFHTTTTYTLVGGILNIPPTSQTRTPASKCTELQ